MAKLFSYSSPGRANPTIAKLQKAWPSSTFKAVPSPTTAYAFRYLIEATTATGRKGYVAHQPSHMFNRMESSK